MLRDREIEIYKHDNNICDSAYGRQISTTAEIYTSQQARQSITSAALTAHLAIRL